MLTVVAIVVSGSVEDRLDVAAGLSIFGILSAASPSRRAKEMVANAAV